MQPEIDIPFSSVHRRRPVARSMSHGGGIDRLFVGLAWIESLIRRIGWEALISGVS